MRGGAVPDHAGAKTLCSVPRRPRPVSPKVVRAMVTEGVPEQAGPVGLAPSDWLRPSGPVSASLMW